MTETRLKVLVTEAVQLDRYIAEKEEQLKVLKAQLVQEAKSRPDDHTKTEGGGTSWLAHGSDGCVARVTFPGKGLKASIESAAKSFEKLKALAGESFDALFTRGILYKPVEDFRKQAVVLLGRKNGQKLIGAFTSKSAPKVSFETKAASESTEE